MLIPVGLGFICKDKSDSRGAAASKPEFPRYSFRMSNVDSRAEIEIRPAAPEDAEAIAEIFLESAAYHAELDPERYVVPAAEMISTRYRERRQPPAPGDSAAITLVAIWGNEVVGFIDLRLEQPSDAMHREMIYCHISEIAVREGQRSRGIGDSLMQAGEDWGRRMGAEFASLEFHNKNVRASSFYQGRMGYRPASITAIKRL